MSFKEMAARDNERVFLDLTTFAERRSIRYDGELYTDIPIVLSGARQSSRVKHETDHAQGLYAVRRVLHCRLSDLGNHQPEKGQRIFINDREGGEGYFQPFYVTFSVCEMGMLRVELEAIDE